MQKVTSGTCEKEPRSSASHAQTASRTEFEAAVAQWQANSWRKSWTRDTMLHAVVEHCAQWKAMLRRVDTTIQALSQDSVPWLEAACAAAATGTMPGATRPASHMCTATKVGFKPLLITHLYAPPYHVFRVTKVCRPAECPGHCGDSKRRPPFTRAASPGQPGRGRQ